MSILALTLDAAYLALLPLSGLALAWEQQMAALSLPWAAAVSLYVTGLALPWTWVMLPLDFYRGFVVEHRFRLSRESRTAWAVRWLKIQALAGLLMLAMAVALSWILRASPAYWWAWMALVCLVGSIALTQWMPVVLMPLFYRQRPVDRDELGERLRRLAQRCQTPIQGVYEIDASKETSKANACLCGLGSTRRVLLTDTLLSRYTAEEIEAVFAHELGHHRLHHLPQMIAVSGLSLAAAFWVMAQALPGGLRLFHVQGLQCLAALPLLALGLSAVGLLLTPLQNGISRSLERAADRFALEMTRAPRAFIAAMQKLQEQNLAEPNPGRWVEWFWYDHPSISKRVAMARQFEGSH
ncbi:MAG: M48 family metallopeptidase [Candidatus Omnitrophica bacterium]|nr:M48 family metallopeptidase [Candidatus Omnitrophota bacterium]